MTQRFRIGELTAAMLISLEHLGLVILRNL
jgi:hypothetical protein